MSAAAVCSYSLLQSLTVPAIPRIQTELHTTQATSSWVLTIFLLAAAIATPIAGRLGDVYGRGRRRVSAFQPRSSAGRHYAGRRAAPRGVTRRRQ